MLFLLESAMLAPRILWLADLLVPYDMTTLVLSLQFLLTELNISSWLKINFFNSQVCSLNFKSKRCLYRISLDEITRQVPLHCFRCVRANFVHNLDFLSFLYIDHSFQWILTWIAMTFRNPIHLSGHWTTQLSRPADRRMSTNFQGFCTLQIVSEWQQENFRNKFWHFQLTKMHIRFACSCVFFYSSNVIHLSHHIRWHFAAKQCGEFTARDPLFLSPW